MTKIGIACELAVDRQMLREMIERIEKRVGAEQALPITSKLVAAYEATKEECEMSHWAIERGRVVVGQFSTHLDCALSMEEAKEEAARFIAAALREVETATARRCIQIVEDGDVQMCGGYERQDDGRATLLGVAAEIEAAFPAARQLEGTK